MKWFKLILAGIVFIHIAGCEGYRTVAGIIKDKATLLPLDSVGCICLTSYDKMITDSLGVFKLGNAMGGCVPKCHDITIKLSKQGYKELIATNPTDSVFYLEKQ